MPHKPLRIAMWSGPRSISTALMRSWGNRPDTFVCDEPLYAHYLLHTKRAHPAAAEVIEHHETDWRKVVAWLTGEVPQGKAIFYQKHMAHHLLGHVDREWLMRVVNCFLIRDPREMLTSLDRVFPHPTVEDTGLPQQAEIFDFVRDRTGLIPPVVDAGDVLEDPRRMLGLWTQAVGVPFSERMLSWPAGRRKTDGVWAKHWYASVEHSTGFQRYPPRPEPLPDHLSEVYARCVGYYRRLYEYRLGR